jgi:hypothetical protein
MYLARMRAHAAADEIVHGAYWENGKGCAVGCLLHSGDSPHRQFPVLLGIPEPIARLEDRLFEGQANGDAKRFAVEFVEAIPVGADLSGVADRFLLWLLVDEQFGMRQWANAQGQATIDRVAGRYRLKMSGNLPPLEEWHEARSAAAAAADAAAAAAYADAYAAADADAAAYAAYAAAAAAYAARKDHYRAMAAKLLDLLREAPCSVGEMPQESSPC